MKPLFKVVPLFVFAAFLFISTNSFALDKNTDWKAFSKNLVKALETSNDGLQQSAMQQIIKYADNLNVKEGVNELLSVFRDHEDTQVRRLALAAIHKTKSIRAKGFLERAIDFESSPVIKKQMYFVINDLNDKK